MELTNQTQKSLNPQWIAKLQETLVLSRAIIEGNAQIAIIEMNLTITDTLTKPNMRSVFKGEHGQIGYSVTNVLVTRFVNSFGFSTKMSETQIETLTVDTLEHFSYESIEDVILFLKMCRAGKFGATGRGVDSNLIFGEWFPKYLDMKSDLRERAHEKEKHELSKNPVSIEDVKKTYQQAALAKMPERVKVYVDKITKGITRDQLEVLIEEWSKDEVKKPYLDIIKRKRIEIKSE